MRQITYSKYLPGLLDAVNLQDLLDQLGDYLLQSGFAGGSNREMDAEQWEFAPYTEADLQKQYDLADDVYGADGAQLQQLGVDLQAVRKETV